MLVRCDCCNGRRTIVGLGGMEKKCVNCHGVGHVKAPADFNAAPVSIKRKVAKTAEKE